MFRLGWLEQWIDCKEVNEPPYGDIKLNWQGIAFSSSHIVACILDEDAHLKWGTWVL
jgi:hypothetical protein